MDLDRAASAHHAAQTRLDEVKKANAERLRVARERVEGTRAELAEAIVQAYKAGTRVGDLAKRADYSRETVRVILRNAGVEPE